MTKRGGTVLRGRDGKREADLEFEEITVGKPAETH